MNKTSFIFFGLFIFIGCYVNTEYDIVNDAVPGPNSYYKCMANEGFSGRSLDYILISCAMIPNLKQHCASTMSPEMCSLGDNLVDGLFLLDCLEPLKASIECQKATGSCFLCK